ncbi:hypothetical protein PYCCODRAFT_1472646 [Trametes coccinea BRFM310]|uniref:Uncharacterized protein n=1 Tax=Trametes coccinea (strain BRFM310) TaxID=1353009 RepID=A0A1Y2I966_TRAC3|nr:hypothetical protein PYCCODRAFT_1472646 [Trametes coccinea BRFM310]
MRLIGTFLAYKGHDYPELLPLPHEVQTVLVPMDETVHYPAIGAPSDAEWLALTTPGFGYIRLGPEDRTFVVSMFHELHCLRMLNLAFNGPNYTSFAPVKHCLNYLRQNILCTPNLALEPGDFETKDFDVDRTHGVHECKNWDQIYEFVASNYDSFTNRTGYTYTPKPVWTGHA